MTPPDEAPDPAQDAALAQFAARVAHDFNNLLTGILGNLELLQLRAARQNCAGLDGYLAGASSAGGRAVALAGRLMAFSGCNAGPAVPVLADAVLSRFVDQADCRPGAPGAILLCDPDQLELAIAELVENGRVTGGQVTLSSSAVADSVIITVRDTGHGMAPEILRRAREPFFTTSGNATGHGLGLAIVERMMDGLGGTMAIASAPSQGCTVTLRLPRS